MTFIPLPETEEGKSEPKVLTYDEEVLETLKQIKQEIIEIKLYIQEIEGE